MYCPTHFIERVHTSASEVGTGGPQIAVGPAPCREAHYLHARVPEKEPFTCHLGCQCSSGCLARMADPAHPSVFRRALSRDMQTTIRDLTVPLHAPNALTENPKKGLILPSTLVMQPKQLSLFPKSPAIMPGTIREKLIALLAEDLDFHSANSNYASHQFHSFPAKYPPQLPQKFIAALTEPGDAVLDPMMGSGTTLVEALLSKRQPIGFDTDPLAVRITKVKTTPLDKRKVLETGNALLSKAHLLSHDQRRLIREEYHQDWDVSTSKFVEYWFDKETQSDLCVLMGEIRRIFGESDCQLSSVEALVAFFEVVFSAIIITKSGGVSLALDLAHTRPHRAKVIYDMKGDLLWGKEQLHQQHSRLQFISKRLRSVFDEFSDRFHRNVANLPPPEPDYLRPVIEYGDAQRLPLLDDCIDLIVTSPPYASNAIDYMRAHKFSLVWMGFSVNDLGKRRSQTIGGESTAGVVFDDLPSDTLKVVEEVAKRDAKKGKVLHRYYSEMTRVLREMHRVLRPGKAAIVVVGSSVMRGRDTETGHCLADIGRALGFEVPAIGIRNLDRNRRMLPAGATLNQSSQIQQRMHQEYVIGYIKPTKVEI